MKGEGMVVHGDKCRYCGEPLPLHNGKRLYCSPSCKKKFYRARKRGKVYLVQLLESCRVEGTPLKDIVLSKGKSYLSVISDTLVCRYRIGVDGSRNRFTISEYTLRNVFLSMRRDRHRDRCERRIKRVKACLRCHPAFRRVYKDGNGNELWVFDLEKVIEDIAESGEIRPS